MIVNKSGVGSATPSVLIVALAFFLPSKWDMTKSSPALLNWKTGANDGKINIKLYLPGIIMKFICFVLMLPLAFVCLYSKFFAWMELQIAILSRVFINGHFFKNYIVTSYSFWTHKSLKSMIQKVIWVICGSFFDELVSCKRMSITIFKVALQCCHGVD